MNERTGYRSDLIRSSAPMVVLSLLERQPMHGYRILTSLAQHGQAEFQFKQGTLYPLLYRLEREGLIESRWEASPSEKKRKVYMLTKEGRRIRRARAHEWKQFTAAVAAVMEGVAHGTVG